VFIGTKMLLIDAFEIPVLVSPGVVVTLLCSAKTAPRMTP
jgi:hypothetical protein